MTIKFNKTQADSPAWDKLCEFIDNNELTPLDFLAIVCANLLNYSDKQYQTEIMVGGCEFNIFIEKKVGIK